MIYISYDLKGNYADRARHFAYFVLLFVSVYVCVCELEYSRLDKHFSTPIHCVMMLLGRDADLTKCKEVLSLFVLLAYSNCICAHSTNLPRHCLMKIFFSYLSGLPQAAVIK